MTWDILMLKILLFAVYLKFKFRHPVCLFAKSSNPKNESVDIKKVKYVSVSLTTKYAFMTVWNHSHNPDIT